MLFQDQIEYLGHVVDKDGLHPSPSKVESLNAAPQPKSIHEVQSLLGFINYYRKFIPNLSTIVGPIEESKRKPKFEWTRECQSAFEEVKQILTSEAVLVYYDPSKDVTLAVDASPHGIGAVISHMIAGEERPIAYASRTLTKAEQNYSQLEKEALAIVFGVRHFHQYLCGKRFILETDHKPLTYLLGPKRGIPVLAASRLQRWAILLAGYEYDIKYRTTKQNANADCLSRLPQQTRHRGGDEVDQFTVLWTDEGSKVNEVQVNSLPVSCEELRKATDKDEVLSKVKYFVLNGWPDEAISAEFQPYYRKRNELTVECGCVLWGIRVVVPESVQQYVLQELHGAHPGMVRMKSLARSHVYWPRLDQQLEDLAGSCEECRQYQMLPPRVPVNPWRWPTEPWQRIHVDFAGPFLGSMFLLVVDSHSKWPEVISMKITTAENTITVMRKLFSRYGLPHTVVSDNGPQFIAQEFEEFLKQNNVEHIKSAVKHPASNGEVERFVQTFKQSMKKSKNDSGNLHQKLDRFLMSYRVTPHSVTKESPSKLFLKRELRTRC